MANHDGNHRYLVEKNVPIALILPSRWHNGAKSLGMERTSYLCFYIMSVICDVSKLFLLHSFTISVSVRRYIQIYFGGVESFWDGSQMRRSRWDEMSRQISEKFFRLVSEESKYDAVYLKGQHPGVFCSTNFGRKKKVLTAFVWRIMFERRLF